MADYRRKLWLNIMEDHGPPEGCIVPLWLRLVYTVLFPLSGLRWLLDNALGLDITRMVWRIHGVDYSDRMFARLAAESNSSLCCRTNVNGVIIVEPVSINANGVATIERVPTTTETTDE